MSSLAQDEIGHARALLGLLGELRGEDPDALAYDREVEALTHCRLLDHPRTDWAFTIARRYLYDEADAVRLEALADSTFTPLAELVAKIRREEVYHRLHASAWLRRLADDTGEARARLEVAWRALAARRRDRLHAAARRGSPRRSRRHRCPERRSGGTLAAGHRRRPVESSGSPCPARPWIRRAVGRPRRCHPLAVGPGDDGPPRRSGGGLVTAPSIGVVEQAIRSGREARPASELESRIWSALADVPDPELPLVSVVDLGLIGRVSASPARIHVELLPTFVGCHALEVMQIAIADRLAGLAPMVEVEAVFDPPWTSDRITRRRASAPAHDGRRAPWCRRCLVDQPRRPGRLSPLRLDTHPARECLRSDPVPDDPLLSRLPPAVRGLQAGLMRPLKVLLVGVGTVGEAIAVVSREQSLARDGWCSPTTTSTAHSRSRPCSVAGSAARPLDVPGRAHRCPRPVAGRRARARARRRPGHERGRSSLRPVALRRGVRGRHRLHGHGRVPVRAARDRPIPPVRRAARRPPVRRSTTRGRLPVAWRSWAWAWTRA